MRGKRRSGRDEILRLQLEEEGENIVYRLFPAYEPDAPDLGRLLFDEHGHWIYDGDDLSVEESEEVARFIMRLNKVYRD